MSDRLVTGRFEHGKFRHELPEHLAGLLEDTAKLLRQGGSQAIHLARVLSTPNTNPAEGATNPAEGRWKLTLLVDAMNKTWRNSLDLHARLTDALAHAEDVADYEDNGCVSCATIGHWSQRRERGRYCSWCSDFKSANGGRLPTPKLIDAHARGIRVTSALIVAEGFVSD